MKAIRPIYDGVDDIGERTELDGADILACLFSHQVDEFEALNIGEEERNRIDELVGEELKSWGPDFFFGYDFPFDYYNEFEDNIAVLYEIVRWLRECDYAWRLTGNKWTKYFLYSLGVTVNIPDDRDLYLYGPQYFLRVQKKAFSELAAMLPLHWATIVYGWNVNFEFDDNNEFKTIHIGDITIARMEE